MTLASELKERLHIVNEDVYFFRTQDYSVESRPSTLLYPGKKVWAVVNSRTQESEYEAVQLPLAIVSAVSLQQELSSLRSGAGFQALADITASELPGELGFAIHKTDKVIN